MNCNYSVGSWAWESMFFITAFWEVSETLIGWQLLKLKDIHMESYSRELYIQISKSDDDDEVKMDNTLETEPQVALTYQPSFCWTCLTLSSGGGFYWTCPILSSLVTSVGHAWLSVVVVDLQWCVLPDLQWCVLPALKCKSGCRHDRNPLPVLQNYLKLS